MGLDVIPHERDVNNISRLEIKYGRGAFETPNRFVNKHDLNSKSGLGVNVTLTKMRNLFINEYRINLETLQSIQNTNDYLANVIARLEDEFNRVDNSNALKALYFSPNKNVIKKITGGSNIRKNVTDFIIDIIENLSTEIDLYLFRVELLSHITLNHFGSDRMTGLLDFLRQNDLIFSPVIPIKNDLAVTNYTESYMKESSLVPFLSYTYSSYPYARNSYRFIMNRLDKIHEKNKAIITLDAPRVASWGADVSRIHYSNFVISDITAESFRIVFDEKGKGNTPAMRFRLFDKDNLSLPELNNIKKRPEEYWSDVSSEINENKIEQLFFRIINRSPNAEDIKNNRPVYMSRIYENIVSTKEYSKMRDSIRTSDLIGYRKSKKEMNSLLEKEQL